MTNKSTFDFLKEDEQFSSVYDKCLFMEYLMRNNSHIVSVAFSRRIAEMLLSIIIKKEFISLSKQILVGNKPLPFINLIKDAYEEGLISSNISDKYNYIRKMGNNAFYDYQNTRFSLDDVKEVHKIIFYLAFDCFKRYNDDKIDGIEYIPIEICSEDS